MATCPYCHGYLNDGHRCGGRWRQALGWLLDAGVGAILGAVMFAGIPYSTSSNLELVGAVLGGGFGLILMRVLRRLSR